MDYKYKATVIDVYDGDTITVFIQLGFDISFKTKLRLYGIDTPEIRGEERPDGLVSRDWLREKILNKEVIIQTYKDRTGKYGRYLATIFLEEVNINLQLIEEGLAEEYII